jgi:hypothetical protein
MSSKLERRTETTTSRSTVCLARHLEKHLVAYAAAASAGLLSAQSAQAEVIFTPSNTPMAIAQLNQGPTLTPLDLTGAGAPQFGFAMSSTKNFTYSGTTAGFKFFLKVVPAQGDAVVQGAQAPTASAVPAGVKIGPQQKFGNGDLYLAINSFNNGQSRNSGTWRNVEFAYVGLKFLINGQVHYGWARVKFPFPGGSDYPQGDYYPSIYGYAYESAPNTPIVAGQTSGTAPQAANTTAPANLGMLAAGAPAVKSWRGANPAQ